MEKFYICRECGELTTESEISRDIEFSGGPGMCSCKFTEIYFNKEINDLDVLTNRSYTPWTEISGKWYEKLKGWKNDALRLKVFNVIPREKLMSNFHIKLENEILQ